MQLTSERLTFSPSDLNHFVECEHLISLDLLAGSGQGVAREKDPQAEIIRAKGIEHERAWLDGLKAQGRQVEQIAGDGSGGSGALDWDRESRRTLDAMRAGVDVIYQGVFQDQPWRGIADFLIRVDTPSVLGSWSYEAWDTKLARHPKPYFILQLCWYTEQLARVQQIMPRRMHVVLGTGEQVAFVPNDFLAYYHAVQGRFLRAIDARRETYPLPVGHCHVCGYSSHCASRREADDHLTLVAGIRRDQVERLIDSGVTRVAQLAVAGPDARAGILPQTFERLTRQARLQSEARTTGHRYQLLTPELRRGFGLLPSPSDGDIFFDIEGYPYFAASGGLEYLWGVAIKDGGDWTFKSFECIDRAGEKVAFEQFIDFVRARLEQYPDLHVYHYAPYETGAIKRLMGQHATREVDVDDLLRREVFVDLYQVVRQSMQISYDSYSLKKVRRFFMSGAGQGAVVDGGESILEFQRFLETGDADILAAIRTYNAEDCESTRLLRDWLLERRLEATRQYAVDIPWATTARAVEESPEDYDENMTLRADLAAAGHAMALTEPDGALAAGLLTNLVDYHRREAKPGWWAYYERLKKSLDELREDTEAIAFLAPVPDVAPVPDKKSLIHTLSFPDQEFKLREGADVKDPVEGKGAGDIVALDLSGTLALRRGPGLASVPLPTAVVAGGPVPTKAQRAALVRIASRLVAGQRHDRVGRDLLARVLPRFTSRAPGATVQTMELDEQKRLVESLDDSYLFIQGPPGSGKTYAGARIISHLVSRGLRVAITATSHKAIHNLLDEVVGAGREAGMPITGIKKSSGKGESEYAGEGFVSVESNKQCEDSDAPIVAGTSWLFARAEMAAQFDYLFIDEAGQVSLADAVAMSQCARNVVLLGDPRQLPHVTQGVHPGRAGVSVLEHILGDDLTVAPDQGLFLEQTWRMHPDVCGFISELSYESRLHAHPDCARQRVDTAGLTGTGLRYLPANHSGNAQQSIEEAESVAGEVRRMLDGGTFTDRFGVSRPLTPADILVVAPYNMQVHALIDALPAGVEVGTVDKFQGREAPVVFFSLATSSGEDIPRGLDFLFSRNRLNVAVSRAKAMAVLVCSPRLLETRCRTVEQMRLVNALCRFVALATA
ncbi:MAG: TM0106 family RecB-like putative nuclease [Vicinamibacterales bacterium]